MDPLQKNAADYVAMQVSTLWLQRSFLTQLFMPAGGQVLRVFDRVGVPGCRQLAARPACIRAAHRAVVAGQHDRHRCSRTVRVHVRAPAAHCDQTVFARFRRQPEQLSRVPSLGACFVTTSEQKQRKEKGTGKKKEKEKEKRKKKEKEKEGKRRKKKKKLNEGGRATFFN